MRLEADMVRRLSILVRFCGGCSPEVDRGRLVRAVKLKLGFWLILTPSGLRMMYEVYKQLQEKAGPRQVKNLSLGLSHNIGGVPGSGVCNIIIAGN
ncbi:MAG: hypothetical protein KKD92_12275 [Proteobacteria bacterium]|nr:hypothetical protein [Pseudomonadota bacterium]